MHMDYASVKIKRSWHKVYIGVGFESWREGRIYETGKRTGKWIAQDKKF